MIRQIITPVTNEIKITVPAAYIGRQIEIIYFPLDELTEVKPVERKTMAAFRGILSKEEADELQEYVKRSRGERERDLF